MHRHEKSRIVVGIKGGTLKKITDTGEESYLHFETGKAYWLEADPPYELHADVNEGLEPIEVMPKQLHESAFDGASTYEILVQTCLYWLRSEFTHFFRNPLVYS